LFNSLVFVRAHRDVFR